MVAKISRRLIVASLAEMLKKGKTTTEVARLLAAYLVKNKRVRDLELYLRDLELVIAKEFNVTTAYVATVRKISQKTRTEVKQLVKAYSGTQSVEVIEEVDPSLLGGIVIRTANAELDGSVRTKLQKLRSI